MPEWLQTIGILGGLLSAVSCFVVLIWIFVLIFSGEMRERISKRRQEEEEAEERFRDRMQDFK